MSPRQAYKEFENTELWRSIDAAVQALIDNGDLVEHTERGYIVGYICKAVGGKRRRNPAAARKRQSR
jgi:hypothetical protein